MTDRPLSITDFLTDGQLTRLCEAAGTLIGAEVALRDASDRRVLSDGGSGWRIEDGAPLDDEPSPDAAPRSEAAVASDAAFSAPLRVHEMTVGRLVVDQWRSDSEDEERRPIAERFVTHLALTVSEVCEREYEQRRRAEELQTLYRLSSMLVGVGAVETMVRTGLRSAVDLLGADLGVIRLLEEDSSDLQPRAVVARRSGEEPDASELPVDASHDRDALAGAVAASDVAQDAPFSRALAGAGFRAMVSAGLAFRGKAIGVIDLYARDERTFGQSDRVLLQSVSQQVAAAIASARLLEAEAESRRVAEQVQLAADVQRRMLPRSIAKHPRVEIAGRYTPCFELGGDFYDVFHVGDKIGFVIADVVGKGVAAALLMSHVRASLRAHSRDLLELDEVMARTNEALCRDTMDNEFATLFYGVVDPETLRLTYCNAGHEPPMIVSRPQGGAPTQADICELSTGGMVLGVDVAQRYQQASIDLAPGDILFASTDGLAEAMNFENEKFGARRIRKALLAIIAKEPEASAKAIAQHVHWEMRRFAGLNKRLDDTTIVSMRIREEGPEPEVAED